MRVERYRQEPHDPEAFPLSLVWKRNITTEQSYKQMFFRKALDPVRMGDQMNPKYLPEGEFICFLCQVSEYHFALGLLWTIEWANRTVEFARECG
jgi:hypothetical protein